MKIKYVKHLVCICRRSGVIKHLVRNICAFNEEGRVLTKLLC